MNLAILPTLAADWVGVVIVLVMLGGSAISYIYKEAKKADELRKIRQRRQMEESGESPLPLQGSTGTGINADELAARRRRELAALAKQPRPTTLQPAEQPANLTVRQAQERALAKAQYEQRAQALRQAQLSTTPGSATTSSKTLDLGRGTLDSSNPETLPPPRPVSTRPVSTGPSTRPSSMPAPGRRSTARRSTSSRPAAAARPTPMRQPQPQLAPVQDRGEDPVHRQVADAQLPSTEENSPANIPTVSVGTSRLMLTGNNMRSALVLSEILRPPVSMREV